MVFPSSWSARRTSSGTSSDCGLTRPSRGLLPVLPGVYVRVRSLRRCLTCPDALHAGENVTTQWGGRLHYRSFPLRSCSWTSLTILSSCPTSNSLAGRGICSNAALIASSACFPCLGCIAFCATRSRMARNYIYPRLWALGLKSFTHVVSSQRAWTRLDR